VGESCLLPRTDCRSIMGGSSDASEDDTAVSHSWADTIPPDSPPLQRRKTFSHYTQVRHNGYLTKRFKLVGAAT
ncbi:unnamed protein product, partial [Ectocarpus sp. 12 AP-2014]